MKYVYEFVGGRYDKMRMPKEAVVAIGNGRFSPDYSAARESGALVPREDLDNQPLVDGYVGPFWDGLRVELETFESYGVIRYETQVVYNMLSM